MAVGSMNLREWGLLISLSVLWGATFIFTSAALKGFPVLTLVWLRVIISAGFVWGVVLLTRTRVPNLKEIFWPLVLLSMTGNVLPFGLIFWGQKEVPGSLAAILNGTAPMFTILFAHWMTRDERMTPRKLVGAILGFSGLVVIIGPPALGHLGESVTAQLLVVSGSAFYALSSVLSRRLRHIPFLILAAMQMSISTVILTPPLLAFEPPWQMDTPGLGPVMAMLGLAILSTGIAYIVYFRLVSTAGAINLSLVAFLAPASAILLGILLLDEHIRLLHLAGLGVIASGLAIVDGRLLRYARRKTPA